MAAKRDFTDRFLKSIKPAARGKRDMHWDAQVPGLGLRVTDKSSNNDIGTFTLTRRWPGSDNPAPRAIGRYPNVSLAEARTIARGWNADADKGVDPKVKEAERRREEDRRRADTFGAAFDAYATERLSRLRTGAEVKKAIERYARPKWGTLPICKIRRADVKELIRGIHKSAPVAGNRTLAYLKTFFAWAAEEELIEASPAAAMKPLADEVRRDRVLSHSEIRAIWEACGELGAFGRAFRFMLATGQRRTECGELAWREIDREALLWTLPRERAKADRAHEIPLSDIAMRILDECPKLNDFVFSTGRGATATGAATPIAGWSKAKAALDKLAFKKLQPIAIERGEEAPATFAEWHLHDLRRTCATNLAKLGVDRIVISKLLNHAEGGVTGIYDRHERDAEKRAAMERWGQRLQEIVAGAGGDNVVQLTARGRDHHV